MLPSGLTRRKGAKAPGSALMELHPLQVHDAGEDGLDHIEGFQLLRSGLQLADRLRLRFWLRLLFRFIPL